MSDHVTVPRERAPVRTSHSASRPFHATSTECALTKSRAPEVALRALLSTRRTEAPRLGAFLRNFAVVHPRYRLHAIHNSAVISDDALLLRAFTRSGATTRPVATALLAGSARVSVGDLDLEVAPGELLLLPAKGECRMAQRGTPYRSLVLEWDAPPNPTALGERPSRPQVRSLTKEVVEKLETIWITANEGTDDALAIVHAVFEILRSVGVPLGSPSKLELADDLDETTARLSQTLDLLVSHMATRPMVVDLEGELGLSARQVNRLVAAFNERYGFNSVGWRDTRNRRRVMMGATLMTAPGATAEYVAQVVGYQSATAFARALAQAGLPSPTAIARAILGER
jgi:AraC-like DNA-binding protein